MFIGLVGPLCSGKNTVCEFLIDNKGFSLIGITQDISLENSKEGRLSISESGHEIRLFYSLDLLLNFVTGNWKINFVIKDNLDFLSYEALRKRPFFLLVAVNSSLSNRFARWKSKLGLKKTYDNSFEDFILANDELMYLKKHQANPPSNQSFNNLECIDFIDFADLTVQNNFPTKGEFFSYLEDIDLLSTERTRPGWDSYFMLLTDLACMRSNCMKRRVGCLIVKDNRVIATGYNGTPRNILNCSEGGCPRCNNNSTMGQDLDICLCIHAEENALLEAGRERISGGHSILYCNTCPCIGCAKKIVQVGIKEVVYSQSYLMDHQTLQLFKSANIVLRRFVPPSIRLHTSIS